MKCNIKAVSRSLMESTRILETLETLTIDSRDIFDECAEMMDEVPFPAEDFVKKMNEFSELLLKRLQYVRNFQVALSDEMKHVLR